MKFSRRSVLRGAAMGAAVGVSLPLLDCFLDGHGAALADGTPIPTRFGMFFWGCGLEKRVWAPAEVGAGYKVTPMLSSLDPYKDKINLFSGFRAIIDDRPALPHFTGQASITTGIAPTTMGQFDGPSLDAIVSEQLGRNTRFRSLEVACNNEKSLSLSSATGGKNYNPSEPTPLSLYLRVFGEGFQDPHSPNWKPDPKILLDRSVLSSISDDRQALMSSLGPSDKARMDQYFTSIRQMEQRLAVELQRPVPSPGFKMPSRPEDFPINNAEPTVAKSAAMMSELLAMALASNQTRVFNQYVSQAQSALYQVGDPYNHHMLTHEEPNDPVLGYQKKSAEYGAMCMTMFASLLKSMDSVKEGRGTLLDNSLILAFTDSGEARVHSVEGIPLLLAGGAGGKVKTGHHIVGNGQSVTRVGLTVQQALGLNVSSWGQNSMRTDKPFTEILAA